ncbi:UNVERIFIED_CONTAM: hypothetical protein PYX00_006467 [Menopon gallinae]|uniref:Uncharacterized protein n=1 Tax=Menopon gallinae TaxID=328185 RepID=A0AAW2HVE3_9NEOP
MFGSESYALIRGPRRPKFEGLLERAYRKWFPNENKVEIAQDVRFMNTKNNSAGSTTDSEDMAGNTEESEVTRPGPGLLRIVCTGKPGRPRKIRSRIPEVKRTKLSLPNNGNGGLHQWKKVVEEIRMVLRNRKARPVALVSIRSFEFIPTSWTSVGKLQGKLRETIRKQPPKELKSTLVTTRRK